MVLCSFLEARRSGGATVWYGIQIIPLIAGGIVDVSGPAIGKDQVGNDGKWLVFFVNLFLYGRNLFGHTQVIEFNPLSEGAVEFLTHTVFNMDVFQNVLKSCGASCQCQASGFVLFF